MCAAPRVFIKRALTHSTATVVLNGGESWSLSQGLLAMSGCHSRRRGCSSLASRGGARGWGCTRRKRAQPRAPAASVLGHGALELDQNHRSCRAHTPSRLLAISPVPRNGNHLAHRYLSLAYFLTLM